MIDQPAAPTSHPGKWLRLLLTAGLALAADQATKAWVMANAPYQESLQPIPALAPFFQITYIHNRGAAFGIFEQAGGVFLIIALAVSIGMVIFYPRVSATARVTQIALGLLLAGALGNAIDRLLHGVVIDFIHYTLPGVLSNVSNLADHAIVGGVLVLVVQSWMPTPPTPTVPPPAAIDG